MDCREWYIIMPLPSFSPGHRQQKMLAVFNEAGPVGRSTGIAFGTVAKVWLGCNKLKARDHQTWKMGRKKNNWTACRLSSLALDFSCRAKVTQQHHWWLKGSRPEASFAGNFNVNVRMGPLQEWAKHKGYAWRIYFDGIFGWQTRPFRLQLSAMLDGNEAVGQVLVWSCQDLDNPTLDGNHFWGSTVATKPILCSRQFVAFSKLFDVYSKLNCHRVESFALFHGVFFPSFHLYFKGSSDLDRVGSMVGKQDWLKEGDRVQFAEMMDQRSLAEIRMNRIAKLNHFWQWCLFSC